MGTGSGFGKVILFGEHFVVYGIPAIASAIEMETTALAEKTGGSAVELEDLRKATPGYKDDKKDQQKESIDRIFRACGLADTKNVKLTLGGSLTAASGVGASAASCVAIARALGNEFGLKFTDERINEIAFEGEKGYHGTPSGLDNTVATFGGLIWFQRSEKPVMEKKSIMNPVEIVMGNSGLVTDTKAAVEGVRKRREENPKKFDDIFKRYEQLAYKARDAIEQSHVSDIGKYMNENHRLLQEIGVSCDKLDFMVNLARRSGAVGAKLTGGGLGGYMVALAPGKDRQKKVAEALEKEGFSVLRTKIGVEPKII
jgi:mevalonate kinase